MAQVQLLDGGMGQELVRRAGDRPTPLWSTSVMMDRPELVEGLHRDFFDAGATIATTNTYALLRDRLLTNGIAEQLEALTEVAITAATHARDDNGGGLVAGSIGPLHASYRPDLCPPPEEAARLYAEPVRNLRGRVDVILFETMSSVAQAEGALLAVADVSEPVWLGVSVRDDDGTLLRSGEPVAALAPLVDRYRPSALLVNCSPPEVIADALPIMRGFGVPFGAYANGFTRIADGFLTDAPTVDALESRTDLDPLAYAGFALEWVRQGATIVGGCCEVGPAHIAHLAAVLRAEGYEIV